MRNDRLSTRQKPRPSLPPFHVHLHSRRPTSAPRHHLLSAVHTQGCGEAGRIPTRVYRVCGVGNDRKPGQCLVLALPGRSRPAWQPVRHNRLSVR